MASAVIHMAVANEVNKYLKRDENKLLIGSIAPDIAKLIKEPKTKGHFLIPDEYYDIPDMNKFLAKYKDHLDDDFVMGYFIHLYTDFFWFKYFLTEISDKNLVTKLDGTVVDCKGRMFDLYVYNDYTNINTRLIDEYNMNLGIFYNPIPEFEPIIEEIPMDKLKIVVDQMGIIIENAKKNKDFVFNIEHVKRFVDTSSNLIIGIIEELENQKQKRAA